MHPVRVQTVIIIIIIMNITVMYSCKPCGLKKIHLAVPARADEDVRAWMEATVLLVKGDHDRRSPHCHPKELSELYIPMTGTNRVGGPTVQ